MKALQLVRIPPPVVRGRLIRDSLIFWLGVRLAFPVSAIIECRSMACVVQLFTRAPEYLPEPSTSLAIVGIVVLISMWQVRRLREIHFLRNLGVTWLAQALLALSVAGSLELTARAVAILFQSPVGVG